MGVILAIFIGVIIAWLDIFFIASAPGALKISFITLGVVAYLVQNRPSLALVLVVSTAVAGDLIVPLPWFGARIIGYVLLYGLCRFLVNSFFPINRPSAVWTLAFILSLVTKFSALFYNLLNYWWAGEEAGGLLAWGNIAGIFISSLATLAAMVVMSYLFSRFDLLARRWFLIRH